MRIERINNGPARETTVKKGFHCLGDGQNEGTSEGAPSTQLHERRETVRPVLAGTHQGVSCIERERRGVNQGKMDEGIDANREQRKRNRSCTVGSEKYETGALSPQKGNAKGGRQRI